MKNKMFFSYSSEHRVMTEMAKRFHKDGEDSPRPLSDETLDTLFHGKVRLWQSRRGHRFSLDALLLTHFATMKSGERVADLGTGNGVIPLIMARRHAKIAITGFEFQQTMVERALRNVKLNQMEKRIQICRGDVRAISDVAASESFDAVVCNPPYRKSGSGRISPNDERQIARHEIHGELKNFLDAAAYLLRLKGRLALVYLANRTVDLLTSMRHAHIEPKRMRLVHSFIGTDASLVLVEGIKGGKSGVEIMRPLVVYRRANQYGAEVAALIAGRK
jgi:tRNA1Val (adenine37-N6)-methyltransferase